MTKQYESMKFYDPFDCNSYLVLVEHYESHKFSDAFDAFDSSAHLMMAEQFE